MRASNPEAFGGLLQLGIESAASLPRSKICGSERSPADIAAGPWWDRIHGFSPTGASAVTRSWQAPTGANHNATSKPFVWNKSADVILRKVDRARGRRQHGHQIGNHAWSLAREPQRSGEIYGCL